jgi:hypothetical protein
VEVPTVQIRFTYRGSRTLAALVLMALVAACSDGGSSNGPSEPFGDFGGTVPTDAELATYPKALPAPAFASGPDGTSSIATTPASYVIPESALPPVQAQGTTTMIGYPGSCEVWSSGYAMGSYAANLTNQQDIKDLANTVSTAYVYMTVLAETQQSCGHGTAAADTLNLLTEQHAPSLAAIPYEPVCACPPGSDQCLEGIELDQDCSSNPAFCTDLSIGSWNAFAKQSHAEVLDLIKTWISTGRVVQTSIVVPIEFGTYTTGVFSAPTSCGSDTKCKVFNGIACGASTTTPTGCAQHGIAIVGYDDSTSAVKIQNSFGPDWGESGYMWMSYATFEAIYLGGTLAFAPPAASQAAFANAAAAADAGWQWIDERDAGSASPRVHLIFSSTLVEPLRLHDITITTPDGQQIVHDYGGHAFRHGHHYLTRHDGRQFEAGTYTVRLAGTTRAGESRVVEGSVQVALVPGSPLAAAPPGDGVTGTNGAPVR